MTTRLTHRLPHPCASCLEGSRRGTRVKAKAGGA